MSKALADRLAEALAEMLHKQAREDWGFGRDERADARRVDRREIPGHPPGLGLPELPRPHREARLVASSWTSKKADGNRPDRVVRDVSRPHRSAASISPIPRPATSRSTSSPATRSKTTPPARGMPVSRGRALARAQPRLRPGLNRRSRLLDRAIQRSFQPAASTDPLEEEAAATRDR